MANEESIADSERRVMEMVLGPNPVMPTGKRESMADLERGAMERVLRDNGIIQ